MPTPPGWEPIGKPPGWEPAGAAEATPSEPEAPESGLTARYRRYVAEPATSLVQGTLSSGGMSRQALSRAAAPFRGTDLPSDRPTEGEGMSRGAAEFLVPQTPTQALVATLTGGAGKLATGLSRPLQALSRVTGGLIGNEAGNAVEGRAPGTGALATGGVLGAIEGASPVLGKVMRSLPGAKGRIAADDAARYGGVMGELSPPLAGATTVKELRALATGPGKAALGATKGAANQEISQGIGAREGTLEIPSLGQTVSKPTAMNPVAGIQPVTLAQDVTKPMTLQEANDAMSAIGAKAYSKNPLDWNFNGIDQRQKYGEVYRDIQAALDKADPTGYSAAQFVKAQDAHKAGLRFLDPLTSDRSVRVVGNESQFNTPYFQQWASNPKVRASLVNKLGQDGADQVLNTLTRGGGQDTRDVLGSGAGHIGSALGQWGRGGNTGFWGLPIALGRTALPNVGSTYAGRAPFTAGAGGQTAADLAALRALGLLPGSQP